MSNKIWKGRESIVRYKNRKKHFFQEENSESYLQFPSIFDTKRVLTSQTVSKIQLDWKKPEIKNNKTI